MKGQTQCVTKGDTNSKESADSNKQNTADSNKQNTADSNKQNKERQFLCFVDRPSLYNLVNKANLVHSLFLVYLFLVYLSISTCFGRLCAHHQEKHLCLCDTWYLLFCVDDCLVCRVEYRTVIHTE